MELQISLRIVLPVLLQLLLLYYSLLHLLLLLLLKCYAILLLPIAFPIEVAVSVYGCYFKADTY